MNQNKRKTSFVVIGVILIIVGIIMFIISATELHDVQTTTTHWADGFMQDYQARTNATNSIPCYMFMVLAVAMVIAGIIMLCIKPKNSVVIAQNPSYSNANLQSATYCPNCKNLVNTSDVFCKTCGNNLKQSNNMPQNLICKNCGQHNEYQSKFCSKCGKEL